MRAVRSGVSIFRVLSVWHWFDVSKTVIPESGNTDLLPHHAGTFKLSVDWGLESEAMHSRIAEATNVSRQRHVARNGTG